MVNPPFPSPAQIEAQMRNAQLDSARRTAKASEVTQERMADLVAAMETQLELAQSAREDAVRAERFTRIMAWSSLAVAVASLGAAVVAIVVSAQ